MGKRGPAPKPTKLKLVEGTFRKDRAVPDEVDYEAGIPPCPKHLGPVAREEWKRITGELAKVPGLLQLVDMALLSAYCALYARWVYAEQRMLEDGLVVEYQTKSGAIMSQQTAWVGIANEAVRQMSALAQQFGFSPSSRTRVSSPGGKGKGQSETERLASKYLG